MNEEELAAFVGRLRRQGFDRRTCEVAACRRCLPSSIPETLSAFANSPSGGLILLGLSRDSFSPLADFDARAVLEGLFAAGLSLTPAVRPEAAVLPLEKGEVVAARVFPVPTGERPCYITLRGSHAGSFIRTADGDRQLTGYEIARLAEEGSQPVWDRESVPEACLDDLDRTLVRLFAGRQRALHPGVFANRSDLEVLEDLRVVARSGDGLVPTVAGLAALGRIPQKFFPSLCVTFACHLHDRADHAVLCSDSRILESQRLVGPIPALIRDTLACVQRNMRTGAIVEGAFRRDVPDYPLEAVREALANALLHRDYSPEGRAFPVAVSLFSDCLTIASPGGLHGWPGPQPGSRDNLGNRSNPDMPGISGMTGVRNQHLAAILETTPLDGGKHVGAGRGCGMALICAALDGENMHPPRIDSTPGAFTITFLKARRPEGAG
ncbi:MAG: ATP-binding protein, partial [Desulfovibrionaceae bacterium]|nr:ATP-binding protein [Desulfovibrionaceae bacterium]